MSVGRRKGFLSRVRCKWKTPSQLLLILFLMLLEGNQLIIIAVTAQNTTSPSVNVTCEPECQRDYFCDITNTEGNQSSTEAHCLPCTRICSSSTLEKEANETKSCQEKCPRVWNKTQVLFTTFAPDVSTFTWHTDIPQLELAPKFIFGLIGALVALIVLFVIKTIFNYLDKRLGPPDEEDKEPILENEAPQPSSEPFSIDIQQGAATIEPSSTEHRTFTPSSVNIADNTQSVQLQVPQEDTTLACAKEPIYGATEGESSG